MTNGDPRVEVELGNLKQRLLEAEETLRAIRNGEVDALVVEGPQGEHVYTLQGADHSYRVLIEAMQQGAVSLAADGTILYCNRSFADMIRRPHETVIGRPATDYIRDLHRPNFQLMVRQAQVGASQGEIEFQVDARTFLPAYVALAPLALPGTIAICMVVTDLTEQIKHRNLQEVNRRKDEFLAMLAHELRNPLAPIRNAARILHLLNSSDPDLHYAKDIIERQVQHLSRLVDDLLDVSRLSLGKVKLQRELVEISTILNRAVESSQPVIECRQHRLHLSVLTEPVLVEADPVRMAQVISNLLTNAAKYTGEGGDIFVTISRNADEAKISVRDTGIGMPADLIPQIFDLFIQGDRTLARSEGGLGIGLTLVKRLVEMHGGSVEAFSRGLGLGSEFVITMPIAKSARNITSSSSVMSALPASIARRHILLVEDNRDGADTLAILLRSLGHEVKVAYNGMQALELAGAFRPHVVLLDIGLPGISGYEVAKELRRFREFDQTTLIATSGYGREEDKCKSRAVGFAYHFVKPIDLNALQAVLQTLSP